MAIPVYSKELWKGVLGGPFRIVSDTPPAGFVWVVRQVTFSLGGTSYGADGQVVLTDSIGAPILVIPTGSVVMQGFYALTMHQVIEQGDNFVLSFSGDQLAWRISGFQLTLP